MSVSEPNSSSKIDKLIKALGIDLGLTGQEIAEIIWLALQRQELNQTVDVSSPQIQIESEENNNIVNVDNRSFGDLTTESSDDIKIIEISDDKTPIYADNIQEETKDQKGYSDDFFPLRVPDAPSIREPLEFAKALRPLMRKVNSGRKTTIDEIETVEQTAKNHGICIPILKAEPEPLFDLVLVIDKYQSMTLWEHTISELQRLLKHYGIFREIRLCGLEVSPSVQGKQDNSSHPPLQDKEQEEVKQKVVLSSGVGKQQRFANARELIDPTGRRLILIVSDCVAPFWHNGAILPLLREWVKYQPLAILQMLPDWMWRRTGLRIGASVQFQNLVIGNSNHNLIIKELLLWKDISLKQGLKIPVLTLEPQSALTWSQMVMGKYDTVSSGFVLPFEYESKPENLPQNRVNKLKAEKRVHRFRMNASPVARKLAGLLSAAPMINLPIVRTIQFSLLPQSQPVHVAEVFLGGLLKPIIELTPDTNSDRVEYQFVDEEIRQLLFKDAPISDSQQVFDAVSQYLEEHFGKSLYDFVALLKAPKNSEEKAPAFAEISFDLLKQLGGDYATFADKLEKEKLRKRLVKALRDRFSTLPEIISFISQILSSLSLNLNLKKLVTSNLQDFISNLILWAEDNGVLQQIIDAIDLVLQEPIPALVTEDINQEYNGQNVQEHEASSIALKTCTYDLATIEIRETHTFNFTVATIEKETKRRLFGVFGEQEKWVIKKRQQQAEGIIEQLGEGIPLELMEIPGGTFWMGTDDEEIERLVKKFDWEHFREERPQHQVTIQPFSMGRYPITQGQWKAIAEQTNLQVNIELDPDPSQFKDDPPQPPLESGETPKTRWDRPVEQVNWYQAQEFCDRLSKLTGKPYRLPTEAEWEYACRAVIPNNSSLTTKDLTLAEWNQNYQQPFHFGDTITGDLANYDATYTYADEAKGEYREQTTPVGYFKVANAFGLYDMHGNVFEWCQDDWHPNYTDAPNDGTAWLKPQNYNPDNQSYLDKNSQNGPNKFIRGGSWINYPDLCRCANRHNFIARDNINNVGFRVVSGPPRT
jgi:formylglycine-generating enzyme required for sulfatase activity